MAIWPSWSAARTRAQDEYETAEFQGETAFIHIGDAWTHWYASEDHLAIQDILYAVNRCALAVCDLLAQDIGGTQNYAVLWMLDWLYDNIGGGAEVNMQTILDAMYDAEQLEYQYFIMYIDAYRANMFNLPFYVDTHADLVRHFA